MAYGGGTWNPPIQNKELGGTYVSFTSKARPSNIFGERGFLAVAINLDWGAAEKIITVEAADLQKDSLALFGHQYTDEELMPLREALLHAKTVYVYRLNADGQKAKNDFIEAKCTGTKGNDFTVRTSVSIDDENKIEIELRIGTFKALLETIDNTKEAIEKFNKENPYIKFNISKFAKETNIGIYKLTNGIDGEETVGEHQKFLDLIESKYINVIAYAGNDEGVKKLYCSYVERRVNQEGAYLQGVVYNFKKNSELIINVTTPAEGSKLPSDIVYWVAGAEAGCEINRTVGNDIYDGELKLKPINKARDQIAALRNGEFVFHEVDNEVRVLDDINSLTEFSKSKNKDFSKNQIIRVLHQIANDWSTIFNTLYLDKELNDKTGQSILWNDFTNHANKLQNIRAIRNFEAEDIIVDFGEDKDAVYAEFAVCPVLAMKKLYLSVIVE